MNIKKKFLSKNSFSFTDAICLLLHVADLVPAPHPNGLSAVCAPHPLNNILHQHPGLYGRCHLDVHLPSVMVASFTYFTQGTN